MLNGIKNFAVEKVLRHVADNPKLNVATNWLSFLPVLIYAALNNHANWMLLIGYFNHPTAAGFAEVLRVAGILAVALLLWLTGKFPGLKDWLPVLLDVVQQAEKDAAAAPADPVPGK